MYRKVAYLLAFFLVFAVASYAQDTTGGGVSGGGSAGQPVSGGLNSPINCQPCTVIGSTNPPTCVAKSRVYSGNGSPSATGQQSTCVNDLYIDISQVPPVPYQMQTIPSGWVSLQVTPAPTPTSAPTPAAACADSCHAMVSFNNQVATCVTKTNNTYGMGTPVPGNCVCAGDLFTNGAITPAQVYACTGGGVWVITAGPTTAPTATATPSPTPTPTPSPTPSPSPTPTPGPLAVTIASTSPIGGSGSIPLTSTVTGGVAPYTYAWKAVNAVPTAIATSTAANPTLAVPTPAPSSTPATYEVQATITDSASNTISAYKTVVVSNASAFYVSQSTGSDSNAGTIVAPFFSLTKCQSAMQASSTKTCYINDSSVYVLATNFNFTSADNYEQWLATAGNTPTIDGNAAQFYMSGTGLNMFAMGGLILQNMAKNPGGATGQASFDLGANDTNLWFRWMTFTSAPLEALAGAFSNSLIDSNTFLGGTTTPRTEIEDGFIQITANGSGNTISHDSFAGSNESAVVLTTSGGAGNEQSNNLITLNIAQNMLKACSDCGVFYRYDNPGAGGTGNVWSYNKSFGVVGTAGNGQVAGFYLDAGTNGESVTGNTVNGKADWLFKTNVCPANATPNNFTFDIWDGTNITNNSGGAALAQTLACAHTSGGVLFNHSITYDGNMSWWNYFWWLAGTSGTVPTVTTNDWFSPAGNAPAPFGIFNGAVSASIPNTNPFNLDPQFTNRAANNYGVGNATVISDISWVALPTDQGPLNSPFVLNGQAGNP